jgi:prevent-host-death family protein
MTRHVPVSEFKDKASELIAAAEAGEEIVITRHGRAVVKLVGAHADSAARKQKIIDDMFALGDAHLVRHGSTSADEIKAWIEEGRR